MSSVARVPAVLNMFCPKASPTLMHGTDQPKQRSVIGSWWGDQPGPCSGNKPSDRSWCCLEHLQHILTHPFCSVLCQYVPIHNDFYLIKSISTFATKLASYKWSCDALAMDYNELFCVYMTHYIQHGAVHSPIFSTFIH